MRGTVAKRLRRLVYGEGGASRARQWSSSQKPIGHKVPVSDHTGKKVLGFSWRMFWTGHVVADSLRREYKRAKRYVTRGF